MLGESTVPTGDTGGLEAPRKVLALNWLFPRHKPASHALLASRYVIGRASGCEIRLESNEVSRRHAEIYRQGPIFVVRDLGSKNGIHVDGERVVHAALSEGQILRISDHICFIEQRDLGVERAGAFGEVGPGLLAGEKLAQLLRPLRSVAQRDLPVIISGETGTGKERVARSIHHWSARAGAFHAVNCAALPAATIEGELFGYRKGAFTGAVQPHVGHIRAAHVGTLFLDEIAELPLETQSKLLRIIEDRQVIPMGESRPIDVDIRILCACQRPLQKLVEAGLFRADLHARLAGYTCVLPPLRARIEDVPQLFSAFLKRYSDDEPPLVEAKLIERLCLYEWPDNVRELELLTRRLVALHGETGRLKASFLPAHMLEQPVSSDLASAPDAGQDRRAHDLERLIKALRHSKGNVTKAALRLGFSRQRAYRLMAGRTVAELFASEDAPGRYADDEQDCVGVSSGNAECSD